MTIIVDLSLESLIRFSIFMSRLCLVATVGFATQFAIAQSNHSITTQADFERAMEELSNWGRWGDTDEKGASNLITPEKRIQGVKVEPGDVILLYTGRWKRREALGPWPTSEGVAGYHADVAYFMKERGVSFIGHDMWNDVSPSGVPEARLPLHSLSLVSLGVGIFDNLDFERVAEVAKELNRYEFLFMASPLRIEKGMGSPLNPIATF